MITLTHSNGSVTVRDYQHETIHTYRNTRTVGTGFKGKMVAYNRDIAKETSKVKLRFVRVKDDGVSDWLNEAHLSEIVVSRDATVLFTGILVEGLSIVKKYKVGSCLFIDFDLVLELV